MKRRCFTMDTVPFAFHLSVALFKEHFFFFLSDPAPPEISPLPPPDALPLPALALAPPRDAQPHPQAVGEANQQQIAAAAIRARGAERHRRGRRIVRAGPQAIVGLVQVARHRSEEHTSELQSQSNLVCRLLLE